MQSLRCISYGLLSHDCVISKKKCTINGFGNNICDTFIAGESIDDGKAIYGIFCYSKCPIVCKKNIMNTDKCPIIAFERLSHGS